MVGKNFLSEFVAGDSARHDHIGEEQGNFVGVFLPKAEGLMAIEGGEHIESVIGKDVGDQLAEGFLVFDDEDSASSLEVRRREIFCGDGQRIFDNGEEQMK